MSKLDPFYAGGIEVLGFERNPEDGAVIARPVGRLELGDGTAVRLYWMPDGLHITVDPSSSRVHGCSQEQIHYSTLGEDSAKQKCPECGHHCEDHRLSDGKCMQLGCTYGVCTW